MSTILAALVNAAILSVPLALLVWLSLRIIPRRSLNASTRYVVWWLALLITIVLPLIYLPLPDSAAHRRKAASSGLNPPAALAATVLTSPGNTASEQAGPSPSAVPLLPITLAEENWQAWVLILWGLISAVMLVRLAVSCVLLNRRKATASIAPSPLTERVNQWLTMCGSSRKRVKLGLSDSIHVPVAAGLWTPAILLPTRMVAELTESEVEQLGLHEAAHLARLDDYALLMERIVEALFVLHPVVRCIASRIDLEREIASDDCVLRATGDAKAYALCLTRVAELTGSIRGSLIAVAAAGARSHLTTRVEMLLDRERHRGTRLLRGRLAGLTAAILLVAGLAGQAPRLLAFAAQVQRAPKQQVSASQPEPVSPSLSPRRDPLSQPTQSPAPASALSPIPKPSPLVAQIPAPTPNPAGTPPTPAPAPSAAPLQVRVNLTVTDPGNRFVTGLSQQHFRLYEDGVEQQILQFAAEDVPLSIGIVLDTSGSMGPSMGKSRQAIAQLVSTARAEDDFLLVLTANHPALAAGPGSKAEVISEKLSSFQAVGRSALLDGIRLAAQNLKFSRNRPLLLVISDGGENASQYPEAEVRDAIREAGAPIYAIAPSGSPADNSINRPPVLSTIVNMVGGQVFNVDNTEEFTAITRKIRVEVTNQYVLSYSPSNAVRDGKFRKLHVEIAQPVGLPLLRLRHRPGYYAPSQ